MIIEVMKLAAFKGGKILLRYFGSNLTATVKPVFEDIVTQADKESQQAIKNTIMENASKLKITTEKIGFIGEEEGLYKQGELKFVIDPLDGTSNFFCGVDYFCVMIGAVDARNNPFASVIFDPMRNVLYSAEKGKGAFITDKHGINKPLPKLKKRPLDELIVEVNFNSNPEISRQSFVLYKRLLPHIFKLRSHGTVGLGLAHVSEGQFGAVVNIKSRLWDLVPAVTLLEEVGAKITDLSGDPVNFYF